MTDHYWQFREIPEDDDLPIIEGCPDADELHDEVLEDAKQILEILDLNFGNKQLKCVRDKYNLIRASNDERTKMA